MSTDVRLLSYNVRSLRDDAHAVAAVIRACEPDLVCIQEAPRFFRWRSKCAALARESGLVIVTGGRPAAAMLLLASLRVRVVETQDVKLSKRRGLHQRGIALGTVEIAGARFAVASIHIALVASERLRHAGEILDVLAGYDVPTIVAGDINEETDAPAWGMFADCYQDGYAVAPTGGEFTSTAKNPRRRIDAVFVDRRLDVVSCGVPDVPGIERASDHRPVLAVVRAG
jgi:endonuclease/exonuclease/phosphatase family metal-dependent hydrolase